MPLVYSLPAKMNTLSILAKALEKQKLYSSLSAPFQAKTRIIPKYFVTDCRFFQNM